MTQCEGWRRKGGAFLFGPAVWSQCENKATVMLEVVQDGKSIESPACFTCWSEVIAGEFEIASAKPQEQGTTKQPGRALIKQSIAAAVADLNAMYEIDLLDQWIAYLLESIEEDIGVEALGKVQRVLECRFETGRW